MLFLRVAEWTGAVVFLAIAAVEAVRLPTDWMFGLDLILAIYAFPLIVWALASAVTGAVRKDVRRVVWSIGLLLLAVPSYLAGELVSDRVVVAYYGPIIRSAMAAEGQAHAYSYPVDDGVVQQFIVYDEIDSDDPAELARAGRIGDPGCDPNARRIGSHFYLVDRDC